MVNTEIIFISDRLLQVKQVIIRPINASEDETETIFEVYRISSIQKITYSNEATRNRSKLTLILTNNPEPSTVQIFGDKSDDTAIIEKTFHKLMKLMKY